MKRYLVVLAVLVVGLTWVLTLGALGGGSVPTGLPAAAPAAAVVLTTPGAFASLTPSRLLDTSRGVGVAPGPVPAGGTVQFQVTGRGGVPRSGVSAVVLSVTISAPTSSGFATVFAEGTQLPIASNLNFVKGQTARNLVVAAVGPTGKVNIYIGPNAAVQLAADVSGYYLSGEPMTAGAFGSLPPSRLLDTRIGVGATKNAVPAGGDVHLQVAGRGGVPLSGVSTVLLNVTVTKPTGPGQVSVSADGSTRHGTSNLSFVQAQTVPNLVFAALGANGQVSLHNGSAGTVQLVADVSGYYLAGAPKMPGMFESVAPSRLLDTRTGLGAATRAIAASGTVPLPVAGRGGVPASGVSAVALNVTVTALTGSGVVSVKGDGSALPGTPNLFVRADQTVSSLVIAPVGAKGKITLHNGSDGTIQVMADIAGYVNSRDKAASVSTGISHSCALSMTGGVKCWGSNTYGELGNGTTVSSSAPVDVAGLGSGVRTVSAGLGYTCALTSAGGVKCWGNNLNGQLGNGTHANSAVPVAVVGLGSRAVGLSAGWSHSCAATSAGGVKCWGRNTFGELGNGTTVSAPVPVDVVGLGSGVVGVEAGEFHSCALTSTGAVKCWGYNAEGELGDGTTLSSAVPVGVVGLGSGASQVSAGRYHSCAVTSAGAARCWGHNPNGELGDGTTTDSPVPVRVVGLGVGAVRVSAGWSHSCALTSSGAVRCWGRNSNGELGNGSRADSAVPGGVVGLRFRAVAVSAGGHHSCAVTSAAALKCWGSNGDGELGNGTTANSAAPVGAQGLE